MKIQQNSICICGHAREEHSWWDWNGEYFSTCGDHCSDFKPDNLRLLENLYEEKATEN